MATWTTDSAKRTTDPAFVSNDARPTGAAVSADYPCASASTVSASSTSPSRSHTAASPNAAHNTSATFTATHPASSLRCNRRCALGASLRHRQCQPPSPPLQPSQPGPIVPNNHVNFSKLIAMTNGAKGRCFTNFSVLSINSAIRCKSRPAPPPSSTRWSNSRVRFAS